MSITIMLEEDWGVSGYEKNDTYDFRFSHIHHMNKKNDIEPVKKSVLPYWEQIVKNEVEELK